MKQSIILLLLVSCLVAELQAGEIFLIRRHYNEFQRIAFGLPYLIDIKSAIANATGVAMENQRLTSFFMEPITDDTQLRNLKCCDLGGPLLLGLSDPLGEGGRIFLQNGRVAFINANGNETIGALKKRISVQRLSFFKKELTDDSKTLDYYQVGKDDVLRVFE